VEKYQMTSKEEITESLLDSLADATRNLNEQIGFGRVNANQIYEALNRIQTMATAVKYYQSTDWLNEEDYLKNQNRVLDIIRNAREQ
jgi:hypothetical protein